MHTVHAGFSSFYFFPPFFLYFLFVVSLLFFPSLLFSLMGVVVERKIGNLEEDNVFVRERRGTELSALFLRVKLNEA